MIAPRAYRAVNPTTQRLVQRIMEDWWAGVCKNVRLTDSICHTCLRYIISVIGLRTAGGPCGGNTS